jgi:hypothetical protein
VIERMSKDIDFKIVSGPSPRPALRRLRELTKIKAKACKILVL